ncbi:MAG: hypothetical protein ABH828_05805, partial [archaeon]
ETYPLIPLNSTPKSFVLEVTSVNHAPNITYVSNTNNSQNNIHSIYMNATDTYDNSTMTFSITSVCSLTNPWTGVVTTNIVTFNESGNNSFNTYANATWTNTLTNNHIICRNITVTVADNFGITDTENILLNISNVNDAPEIQNFSHNPGDILNNNYINNLTAFLEAQFIYQINATDIDLNVEYNPTIDNFEESLTYTSNDSAWLNRFLDSSTGLINIPAENITLSIGNHTFLINVSDNGPQSLSDTVIMTLEIRNNTAPTFNQTLNKTCYEYDSLNWATSCTYNLSEFASDAEGHTITFSDDSGTFNVSSVGILSFNANQNIVNEHTFNVTITDTKGANTTATMYLYIYNTNNNPNITNIPTRNPPTGLYYQRTDNNVIPVIVSDSDEEFTETNSSHPRYDYETITFSWSSGYSLDGYITISNSTRNMTINTSVGIGNFSINITATDFYNKTGNYTYNFTIHNVTAPPKITFIYPYGLAGVTTFGWLNVTDQSPLTYINVTENNTIFFNQTVSDENPANLTYKWLYNNIVLNATTVFNYNSTAKLINGTLSTNFTFGFFEAGYLEVGNHNLTLVVTDGFDETLNDSFTWNINVTDKNRPVVLDQPIANITIEGSRNVDNKDLWIAGNNTGFYDPDYDYNSDEIIAFAETNFSIAYSIVNSTCGGYATINVSDPYATLFDQTTNATWISGHGIVADAVENGTCNLTFVATDGEYSARSNTIEVTSEVTGEQTTIVITTTSSGGGTRTVTTTIPYPEEVEVPIPIKIIMPDMVTVYENNSIDIPLTISNTWNKSVFGVNLGYEINESYDYIVNFGRTYFYEIKPEEEIKTTMTITNYRVGGIYEVTVIANVTDPAYVDTAKIYLNSIEQTNTGERVKTLIRFAKDLLQKNKECQEIAEVLNEAEKAQEQGKLETALEMANSAINGCKYIISQEQKRIESPRRFRSMYIPLNKENLIYVLYFATPILLLGGGYAVYRKRKLTRQEAKKEQESEISNKP